MKNNSQDSAQIPLTLWDDCGTNVSVANAAQTDKLEGCLDERQSEASHLQGRSPCRKVVGQLINELLALQLGLAERLFAIPQPTPQIQKRMVDVQISVGRLYIELAKEVAADGRP